MLRVHVERGRHPAALRRWFPAAEPDPFFEEYVLTALYGDCWASVLIEEDGHAWRHAFCASPIGSTGLFDIEPLVGYFGPLTTPNTPSAFLRAALDRYTTLCRNHGIVAELIRFNPLLQNHVAFDGVAAELTLSAPKPVVYLRPQHDDTLRMASYPRATRNMVRAGYRSSDFSNLDKTDHWWRQFRDIVDQTLNATGAAPYWRFSEGLWRRLQQHDRFVLFAARREDRLVAAALALVQERTWYYFVAAGVREPEARRGAGNALVDRIGHAAALNGARHLGLGGGNTGARRDSLFEFKNSFGGDVLGFRVGFFVHDRAEHRTLLQAAERSDPSVVESPLFLRYRLAPAYAEGRMIPAPVPALAERTS